MASARPTSREPQPLCIMRQCLLGTRVELTFAKAPFAGTAQGYEVFSDFGDRIQHQVVFDDGFVQDYARSEVLASAEAYIRVRAASGANVPAIAVQPVAPSPNTPTAVTRNTRAPHFTPQHWLLCHMGLY